MQQSQSALDKNKRGYIKLDSDEEWDKFFELQNDPDTNTTNKEPFSAKKGESHYHGKEIIGKIADQIKAEISEGMKNHTIGSIMIKEGKREENIVYPTVRVVLHANKEGVDIAKLLGGSICKEYGVRTITFCHPNQEKRYRLASQQKNYSSCIIKSKNTSDCVTVHRLQLVNMLNGLEAFFDFKLQSTS
ncbi:UNVERIFIED_CONTAM: hypothetical protein LBW93_05615 [Wolbachia endosymbiont of Nasonia longicornis]